MVGPTSQQDVELSALYRDAVITYGEGKVLGILATKTSDHEMRKRAAPEETTESQTIPNIPSATTYPEPDQGNQTEIVYYPGDQSAYKILLYISAPPRLFDGNNLTILNDKVPTTITTDRRNQNENSEQRTLKVCHNYKDKVRFKIS